MLTFVKSPKASQSSFELSKSIIVYLFSIRLNDAQLGNENEVRFDYKTARVLNFHIQMQSKILKFVFLKIRKTDFWSVIYKGSIASSEILFASW